MFWLRSFVIYNKVRQTLRSVSALGLFYVITLYTLTFSYFVSEHELRGHTRLT